MARFAFDAVFTYDNPQGVRNALGQFEGAYNKLYVLYGQLSSELASETGNVILEQRSVRNKNTYKNRKPPKGELAKVTKSQDNTNRTHNGFEVGLPEYLNNSTAKYWRIIEEGSAVAAPRYTQTMVSGWWRGERPTGSFRPEGDETRLEGLPRKNILPVYAYRQAWERLNATGQVKKMWRDMLVDAGFAGTRGPLKKSQRIPNAGFFNY